MHTGEAFGSTGRLLWFLAGISLFLLYVSGLLRWLHRHGKIKDRDVNFSELRPLFFRMQKKTYQMVLTLFRLILLLLHSAKHNMPVLIKACMPLWLRVKSCLEKTNGK